MERCNRITPVYGVLITIINYLDHLKHFDNQNNRVVSFYSIYQFHVNSILDIPLCVQDRKVENNILLVLFFISLALDFNPW